MSAELLNDQQAQYRQFCVLENIKKYLTSIQTRLFSMGVMSC